jgi:hypothetical protein
MPSLRRSFSAPVPRSSPYPSSAAVRAHPRRPSSGTGTKTRRVLADIPWWSVTEGQVESAHADPPVHEQDENAESDEDELDMRASPAPAHAHAPGSPTIPTPGTTTAAARVIEPTPAFPLAAGIILERPTTPTRGARAQVRPCAPRCLSRAAHAHAPQLPFRAPHAHALRMPMRRYASESSDSSVESSPDLPLTPRDSLAFFDPGFDATASDDEDMLPVAPAMLRAFARENEHKSAAKEAPPLLLHDFLLYDDMFA